ncbi:MAG TPA: hypothetical protein VM434_05190, partial [Beijerinckiaceae bacterium]|nr:hypothetical protein [Beijerinckiaceae bacterium]
VPVAALVPPAPEPRAEEVRPEATVEKLPERGRDERRDRDRPAQPEPVVFPVRPPDDPGTEERKESRVRLFG